MSEGRVQHQGCSACWAGAQSGFVRGQQLHARECRSTPPIRPAANMSCPHLRPCLCTCRCEPTMEAREATCAAIQQQTGATFVPPFNSKLTIAGQGTIGLEFLEQASAECPANGIQPAAPPALGARLHAYTLPLQAGHAQAAAAYDTCPPRLPASNQPTSTNSQVPELEAIIVPVSGGGMVSGIAVAAKALKPSIKIIAAEPAGRNDAADVAACKAVGQLVQVGGRARHGMAWHGMLWCVACACIALQERWATSGKSCSPSSSPTPLPPGSCPSPRRSVMACRRGWAP